MLAFLTKQKKKSPPSETHIDSKILDAHLCSIKACLLEIVNYKKKRFAPTPTHTYWRPVDIEDAWTSVKEPFAASFRMLCKVASELHVAHNFVLQETSFHEALQTSISLIDKIDQHIQITVLIQQHTNQQLHHIDEEILQIQCIANKINKHVTKDFKYPA